MSVPKDPILLLSYINTKLRDFYDSLDALCEDLSLDPDELCRTLRGAGYHYDAARNRFI